MSPATKLKNFCRKKLEANFGSVEKLLEQTGLNEKELYLMAAKVLFGSLEMEWNWSGNLAT